MTTKATYAEKYCQKRPKVFIIGFVVVGNPFPVIEQPFMTDDKGEVIIEKQEQKDKNGMNSYKPKKNEKGYLGQPLNHGYQSHFTIGLLSFLSYFSILMP